MKKVILNKCYGGFDVSTLVYVHYAQKLGKKLRCYKFAPTRDEDGHFNDDMYKRVDLEEALQGDNIFMTYRLVDEKGQEEKINLDSSHREDPLLIEIVENLGKEANSMYSDLKIVEIPDELVNNYMIDNYDGIETLHQKVDEY